MRLLSKLALAIALSSVSVTAGAQDILIASGLVCDTKQQAERFVSLMSDDNVDKALIAVNDEAGQADACVVATFGFFPGQKVAEVQKNGTVVQVIEVLVMAVAARDGLKVIEPKMYYSVMRAKDRIT